jgi:hypothetical protein
VVEHVLEQYSVNSITEFVGDFPPRADEHIRKFSRFACG